MKFKQEIFIFILLVFLIFSISVVSANQSLDDTSNDELVLLSNNNEPVNTMDVSLDTVQDNDSADSNGTAETDESENGQNQKNVLGASNSEKPILKANTISIDTYVAQYGFTFTAIQNAINAASVGDNIFLNGHNFIQTSTVVFTINKNINIYGGRTVSDSIMATLDGKNLKLDCNAFYGVTIKNVIFANFSSYDRPDNVFRMKDSKLYNCVFYNNIGTGHVIGSESSNYFYNCNFTDCRVTFNDHTRDSGQLIWMANGTWVDHCNFINTKSNHHSGAICIDEDKGEYYRQCAPSKITNSMFINVTSWIAAVYIHGAHTSSSVLTGPELIENCTFINCVAEEYAGAIGIGHDGIIVKNCKFYNNSAKKGSAIMIGGITKWPDAMIGALRGNSNIIVDCYFEGNIGTEEGGAVHVTGTSTSITNCTFVNNTAKTGNGAAIYIIGEYATINDTRFYNHTTLSGTVYITGNNAKVIDSTFENNTATNGAGVYIDGSNAKINNSNFNNNSAVDGAGVYITGQYAVVQDSSFDNNTAVDGAGVYIKGVKVSNVVRSDAQIMDNDFTGNNVSREGGAVYIEGSYSTFAGNNFTENNAIPSLDNQGNPINDIDGLGGAIYIVGSNTVSANNTFTHNTARNGSAIYTDGSNFKLENDVFKENQAWSYLLITTAVPEESYYNENDINVTVIHKGGDNVLNAIFNKAAYNTITFKNVTYSHSKLGNITSPDTNFYLPHDGATPETTLYQDSREHYQLINLTIINNEDNSVEYHNATLYTDIYGNVTLMFPKGYFKKGTYTVYAEHPEDWNYKYIANTATFTINYSLKDNKTVSNKTPYYGTEVDFNLTIRNDADAVYNDNILNKLYFNRLFFR